MMKLRFLSLALLSLALTSCDTFPGIIRRSDVHALPDLNAVKARIESYPEIKEVKMEQSAGSRPLTLAGIQAPDEVFYLSYTDHQNIHGTLMFERDYKGDVSYWQGLFEINRQPPQAWIDATWPVMKKIENDLVEQFGLPEIRTSVKSRVSGVQHPGR